MSASARLKPAMPVTPMIKATGVSEVLGSMVREKKRRGRVKKKREPGREENGICYMKTIEKRLSVTF